MSTKKINTAANTVADFKKAATAVGGVTPYQLRSVIGRLAAGQDEDFKALLVDWLAEAEVTDEHRAVVEAASAWKAILRGRSDGTPGHNRDLDDRAPELVEVESRNGTAMQIRVGFHQLVAWGEMLTLAGITGFTDVMDARGNTSTRGLLRKLGLSAQDITARFPGLSGGTANRSVSVDDLDDGQVALGRKNRPGKPAAAAPVTPQGFTAKQIIDAFTAAEIEPAKTLAVVSAAPADVKALIAACTEAEIDAVKTLEVVAAL